MLTGAVERLCAVGVNVIAPIVRLNLGEDAPLPILKLLVEDPEDLSMLADHVVKLTQAGLPIPQWWVRERFGIPEAVEGEAVLGDLSPGPSPQGRGEMQNRITFGKGEMQSHSPYGGGVGERDEHAFDATSCGCAAHAQAEPDLAAQAPDLLADRLEIEAEAAWDEIMARIQAIVDAADSLPSLRDALLAAFGDLPTDRLAEVMAMGFAAADLAGRFAVEVDSETEGGNGR